MSILSHLAVETVDQHKKRDFPNVTSVASTHLNRALRTPCVVDICDFLPKGPESLIIVNFRILGHDGPNNHKCLRFIQRVSGGIEFRLAFRGAPCLYLRLHISLPFMRWWHRKTIDILKRRWDIHRLEPGVANRAPSEFSSRVGNRLKPTLLDGE